MIMVKNTQNQSISNIIIFLIILVGVASIQISNTYGAIKDQNFDMGKCKNEPETLTVLCCWTETDEEGIEIEYCQSCNVDTDKGEISNECGGVFTDNTTPPTASDSVLPKDGKILDEQPKSDLPTSGNTIFEGQMLEQAEIPSQSPSSSSSSGISSSDSTTGFANKGGSQAAPVPPECPKQGPIPPDCTMKPKF